MVFNVDHYLQVHKKLASSASKGDVYETELLEQFTDTDAAKEFFSCLDFQLNKVNQFYKAKEKEFLDRGESLKKQMEILIEVKTAFNQQHGKGANSLQDSKEDESVSCTLSRGTYFYTRVYTYSLQKMHIKVCLNTCSFIQSYIAFVSSLFLQLCHIVSKLIKFILC